MNRGMAGLGLALMVCWPGTGQAQSPCQPLQGTAAHATCLNQSLSQSLSRSSDPALRALEDQARGVTAPQMLETQRTQAPPPAYSPDFTAGQAARTRQLEQATQSRAQSLSGQVSRDLSPGLGQRSGLGHGAGHGVGTYRPGLGH